MEKIYGYKEKDVLGLAEFLKDRKGEPLSAVFEKYAIKSGKAKGTVRNLYYALAKTAAQDVGFREKYLDGMELSVGKIVEFDADEERKLVKEVLSSRKDGRSVRGTIMEMANGDGKIALRYQNKFRNAMRNKPHLIAEIVKELKDEGKDITLIDVEEKPSNFISEVQLSRVKSEINGLVGRISHKLRRENEQLKARISFLESENLKLSAQLYGGGKKQSSLRFFRTESGENVIN